MKNQTLTPILLPTEDASLFFRGKELVYFPSLCLHSKGLDEEGEMILPQHLYLCSTLPILVDDWMIRNDNVLIKATEFTGIEERDASKKIEFTTDPKLHKVTAKEGRYVSLDGVPAIDGNTKALIDLPRKLLDASVLEVNFLEEYCNRYNQKDNQKVILDTEQIIYEEIVFKDGVTFNSDGKKQIVSAMERYKNQSNAGGFSLEDMLYIVRHTIKQWSSLNEQREKDHKQLVENWIDNDLKLLIQSLTKSQPKGDIIIELNDGNLTFK